METLAEKNGLSSCCPQIRINSNGGAGEVQTDRMGLYVKFKPSTQNEDYYVYKLVNEDSFLYYLSEYNDWSIGTTVEGSSVGIQSGKVTATDICPEGKLQCSPLKRPAFVQPFFGR